jgi:hypothetical protein
MAELEQGGSAQADHTKKSRREQEPTSSNALAAANENAVTVSIDATEQSSSETTKETRSVSASTEPSSMVALHIGNDETCEILNDTLDSVNLSQGNGVAYVEGSNRDDDDGNPTASPVPVATHAPIGAHPDGNATLLSALENRGRIRSEIDTIDLR